MRNAGRFRKGWNQETGERLRGKRTLARGPVTGKVPVPRVPLTSHGTAAVGLLKGW